MGYTQGDLRGKSRGLIARRLVPKSVTLGMGSGLSRLNAGFLYPGGHLLGTVKGGGKEHSTKSPIPRTTLQRLSKNNNTRVSSLKEKNIKTKDKIFLYSRPRAFRKESFRSRFPSLNLKLVVLEKAQNQKSTPGLIFKLETNLQNHVCLSRTASFSDRDS
jgi:hypothetical protein